MTSIVVGKDRISLVESERYVAGTKNAYYMSVTFSKDWEGLEKHVVFRTDSLCTTVDISNCSERFLMPNELFAKPTNKLQVGVYSNICNCKVDIPIHKTHTQHNSHNHHNKALNTRWLSLGRVQQGVIEQCGCECKPPSTDLPCTLKELIDMINSKADGLTLDEKGYLTLWAGDIELSSIKLAISDSGEPVEGISATIRMPLGCVIAWSGSIDTIPEGYSLCDGQNGTVDLRNAFIVGASEEIPVGPYGEIDVEPDVDLDTLSADVSDSATRIYALAFIQKTSITQADEQSGKSAYEIAVDNGFEGDEAKWLESLKGQDGKSAYEIAKELNPEIGDESEWLESLKGSQGQDGKSAYEIAKELNSDIGNESEWLESLKGQDGKSAYEIAKEHGYNGTEEEWIKSLEVSSSIQVIDQEVINSKDSLPEKSGDYLFKSTTIEVYNAKLRTSSIQLSNNIVSVDLSNSDKIIFTLLNNIQYTATLDEDGHITEIEQVIFEPGGTEIMPGEKGDKGDKGDPGENGKSAYEIAKELDPSIGDEVEWLESLKGKDGASGKSAYEIAKEQDPQLQSEQEWLESLKGPQGQDGLNGKSAYEIAKELNPDLTNEQEWLDSLKGQNGSDGKSAYQIALDHDFQGSEEDWLASLQGEPGEDGKSYQTIQDYNSNLDTLIGRWIDGKPVKRKVISLKDIEVTTSGVKPLSDIEGELKGLIPVNLSSIATFLEGDNKGILLGSFSTKLPAMCNDAWISLRYYSEESETNFYLCTSGITTSITFDLSIIFDYVNPEDDELDDDDLIVDPGEGTGTSDHRYLTNRDATQQHPISAITNLTNNLAVRPSVPIDNSEIDKLFNT